jgi:curved DNA-binding protein CbpA
MPQSQSQASDNESVDDPLGYYKCMGLVPTCDASEIKGRYFAMNRELHPDSLTKNADDENENVNGLMVLRKAYSILSNPLFRAFYDKHGADAGLLLGKDLGGDGGYLLSGDVFLNNEEKNILRQASAITASSDSDKTALVSRALPVLEKVYRAKRRSAFEIYNQFNNNLVSSESHVTIGVDDGQRLSSFMMQQDLTYNLSILPETSAHERRLPDGCDDGFSRISSSVFYAPYRLLIWLLCPSYHLLTINTSFEQQRLNLTRPLRSKLQRQIAQRVSPSAPFSSALYSLQSRRAEAFLQPRPVAVLTGSLYSRWFKWLSTQISISLQRLSEATIDIAANISALPPFFTITPRVILIPVMMKEKIKNKTKHGRDHETDQSKQPIVEQQQQHLSDSDRNPYLLILQTLKHRIIAAIKKKHQTFTNNKSKSDEMTKAAAGGGSTISASSHHHHVTSYYALRWLMSPQLTITHRLWGDSDDNNHDDDIDESTAPLVASLTIMPSALIMKIQGSSTCTSQDNGNDVIPSNRASSSSSSSSSSLSMSLMPRTGSAAISFSKIDKFNDVDNFGMTTFQKSISLGDDDCDYNLFFSKVSEINRHHHCQDSSSSLLQLYCYLLSL